MAKKRTCRSLERGVPVFNGDLANFKSDCFVNLTLYRMISQSLDVRMSPDGAMRVFLVTYILFWLTNGGVGERYHVYNSQVLSWTLTRVGFQKRDCYCWGQMTQQHKLYRRNNFQQSRKCNCVIFKQLFWIQPKFVGFLNKGILNI